MLRQMRIYFHRRRDRHFEIYCRRNLNSCPGQSVELDLANTIQQLEWKIVQEVIYIKI